MGQGLSLTVLSSKRQMEAHQFFSMQRWGGSLTHPTFPGLRFQFPFLSSFAISASLYKGWAGGNILLAGSFTKKSWKVFVKAMYVGVMTVCQEAGPLLLSRPTTSRASWDSTEDSWVRISLRSSLLLERLPASIHWLLGQTTKFSQGKLQMFLLGFKNC